MDSFSECHYYSFGISLKQRIPNIKKVKDISVDDYLSLDVSLKVLASLSDLEKVSKKRDTIFSSLRSAEKLERLSMLNLKYTIYADYSNETHYFPQKALLKFVRNTLPPSVRWLRSDLSKANIDILQVEYPNIEFVSS